MMKNKKRNFLLIWILALALLLNVLAFVPVVADEITVNLLSTFEMTLTDKDGKPSNVPNGAELDLDMSEVNAITLLYGFMRPDDLDINDGDTYEFELPAFFEGVANNIPITVDGVEVATYSIVGNKVVITFHEAVNDYDDVLLNIQLNGTFDTTVFEEETEVVVEVPFAEDTTYTAIIRAEQEPYSGTDKKTAGEPYSLMDGDKVYDPKNPQYVDWTVRVNDAMESFDSAKVVDDLSADLKLVPESIEVYRIIRNYKNEEIGREEITVTHEMLTLTANGFELDLGDIEGAYEIAYTTEILRPEGGGTKTINNDARIILNAKDTKVSDSFTGTWSGDIPAMNKTGTLTDDPHRIDWTVEYNYGKDPLGMVTLTDYLGENQGEIALDSLLIWQVDTDIDGKVIPGTEVLVTGIIATIDEDGRLIIPGLDADEKAYQITFSSSVPIGLNNVAILNTVEDNLPEPNKDDATVVVHTIPSGGKVGEQYVDEEGNPYIEWTITLNPERIYVGKVEIADLFNPDYLEFNTESSWFEMRHVHSRGSITTEGYQYDIVAKNSDYTIEPYQHDDDGRKGFKLELDPVGQKEYKFVYRTYYTVKGMKQPQLANEAALLFLSPGSGGPGTEIGGSGGTFKVSLTGPKAGIKKTGTYVTSTNKTEQFIEWTVTFNQSGILLETGSTLTDVFTSGNFSYVADTLVVKAGSNELTPNTDYNFAMDANGFVITLSKPTQETLTVTFRSTTDSDDNLNHENTATLKWQGGEELDKATVTKRDAGVSKSGSVVVDEEGKKWIDWKIEFNTSKNVIYDFVLTDTYTPATMTISDLVLKKDGVTLTAGDDGDYTYTPPTGNNGEFKINIAQLDAVEYVLTYRTSVSPEEERNTIQNKVYIRYTGGSGNHTSDINPPTLGVAKSAVGIEKEEGQDPVIFWTITANTDTTNHYVTLVDAFLEDNIPLDQKLLPETIELKRVGEEDAIQLDGSNRVTTDNYFKISLPDGAFQYTVTFQTKILEMPSHDSNFFDRYNNDTTLTNQSKSEELKRTAEANAWIDYFDERNNNLTDKTGAQNEETENVDYALVVNPEGLIIHNAKISDSLSNRHSYVDGSIKVFDDEGLELTVGDDYNLEIASDNRSFVITFKVGKNTNGTIKSPYTIKYSTRLNANLIGTYQVTNKIVLTGGVEGKELHKTETSTSAQQWFYGGGGSGRTLTFNLLKRNNHIDPKPVAGAVFKLVRVNLLSSEGNERESVVSDVLKTGKEGTASIDDIRAGTYYIDELETPKLYDGTISRIYFTIGYTATEGVFEVTITNDEWSESATHSHAVAEGGTLVITNDYKPTSVTFTANKALIGQPLEADQFRFELLDEALNVLETVGNDADGLVMFTQISYTDTGAFTYTLREVNKDQGGMTYDQTEYTINVVVSEGDNGLEAEVTYLLDDVESKPTFSNVYKASGSFTADFEKVLDGGGRKIKDGEFTFVLTPVDGAPIRTSADSESSDEVETTNDGDGKFSFELFFNQDDLDWDEETTVYQYIVSEKDLDEHNGDFGMEYDTKKVPITVTLQDLRNGEISVVDNYDGEEGNDIVFRNTYKAFGQWKPEVTKKLLGRRLKDKEFEFELISYGKIQPLSVPIGDIEGPLTTRNDGSGVVTFEWIEFSEDDIGQIYEFLLFEVKPDPSESGMRYDESIYLIEVAISDAGKGVLAFETTYYLGEETAVGTTWELLTDDGITFINRYSAGNTWTPNVTKELVGRELKDKEFEFVLKGPQGNVIEKVKNDADGNVVFSSIGFSEADIGGSYTYTIEEVVGSEPGMSYDTRSIKITVSISDAGGGVLNINASYPAVTTFVNRYSGPSGITVTANKVWKDLPSGWTEHLPTIWFKLYRSVEGGTAEAVPGLAMQKLPAGVTQVSWNGLEKYDPDGKLYVYSVQEVDENGKDYEPKYFEKTEKGLTVTNAFNKELVEDGEDFETEIDVTGRKVWKGVPKGQTVPTIWLRLYRHIEGGTPVAVPGRPIMELRPGVTQGTWKDLEKVDEDYNYYIYTVKEVDSKGNDYEPPHFRKTEEGLTVTNTHTAGAPVTGETLSVYTIMGAMLMALAALFLILTGRKRAKAK